MTESDTVGPLIEHLFRHESGKLVAILTRIFGLEYWQLAEDVVQETLLQALRQWPYRGVPENPGGWLMQTARHRTLDVLRREANLRRKLALIDPDAGPDLRFEDTLGDGLLTMLFIGCHPVLTPQMQIALLLKTLCGFGVSEIARAFMLPETTAAQWIVRAKRKIRDQQLTFALPPDGELLRRLDGVLAVLYLLFNEGYNASHGPALIRRELCAEAIRLGTLLAEHRLGQTPRVHALLAFMYLQASRLPARTDAAGDVLLLPDQDRARWDQGAIRRGLFHLEQATTSDALSEYHLLAGAAACHALARDYADTDWPTILFYYDHLVTLNPSPTFALNRAVAVAMVEGAEAGLRALDAIHTMGDYYLLHATYGELYTRLGQTDAAEAAYRRALALTVNQSERRFLERKLSLEDDTRATAEQVRW